MIEARGVVVRAGAATLLAGVDLEVARGELVAVVGANGAGKSTLLAAIAGDLALAAGSIRIAGRDVVRASPGALAALRAVVRQRSQLSARFTAREVVELGQPRRDEAAALACLGELGLAGVAARDYLTLSGGEQQRVQLARALAQLRGRPPGALLLDEPTAALDLGQQHVVEQLARRAAADGHAVVLIAHDLDLVARCAARVVVLCAGRVLASGPPGDVITSEVVSRAYATQLAVERTSSGAVVVRPTRDRAAAPALGARE